MASKKESNLRQFYLKVYDKEHNILDNSINNLCSLKYKTVLNGQGSMEFSIPLDEYKCNNKLMFLGNHIEVYNLANELLWYGVIILRRFSGTVLSCSCVGYEWLLSGHIFKQDIIYYNKTYGNMINQMLSNINNNTHIGVSIGNIIDNSLETTREINTGDDLKDKIDSYIEDSGYYYNVDSERKLNVTYTTGEVKEYLKLEYDPNGYSNIIELPAVEENLEDIFNYVYAESSFEENEVKTILISTQQDDESIALYGLREEKLSVNDIRVQDTLDYKVSHELNSVKYPNVSLTIKCVDSALCPMDRVKKGDYITVSLPTYFGFKGIIRVLEIERDCKTNEYTLTMGTLTYRPAKPQVKKYKR